MAEYVNTDAEQLVVELQVRHMGRATAFYRELGFDVISESDDFTALAWDGRHLFHDLRDDCRRRGEVRDSLSP